MQGYNILIYCGNSPVNRIDVSGRASYDCVRDDDALDGEYVKNDGGGGGSCNFDVQQAILDGKYPGGYSYGYVKQYNALPSSLSTGRSTPLNLEEQIALKVARTNPHAGKVIIETLGDVRFQGFSKFSLSFLTKGGFVSVHYVGNLDTNTFGDFKIK